MSTDLLEALRSSGVDDLLPGELERQLRDLGVFQEGPETTHGDVHVRRATVLPLSARGLPQVNNLPIEAPGLNSGLRVQVAVERPAGGSVRRWAVDLDLDRVAVQVPDLRPAREVSRPAQPTVLVEDPTRSKVRIVGRAVLRVAGSAGAAAEVSFIDKLDRDDPFGSHGPLATLNFEPPSFLLGSSSFGFTVEDLTYDSSTTVSPTPKPAAWQGIALRRATLFLPPGAPLVGDVSLGVRDVFLGDPVGVEGTAFLEFGGEDGEPPPTLALEQENAGSWEPLTVSAPVDGMSKAPLQGQQPPAARLKGRLEPVPTGDVSWRLSGKSIDPSDFSVRPGDVLEVQVGEQMPLRCVFTGNWAPPPAIRLTLGPNTWEEVASLTAAKAELSGARFSLASAGAGVTFEWRWDGGATSADAEAAVPADLEVGVHDLELLRDGDPARRVRVEVRARGPLLVGCGAGTFTAGAGGSGTPVPVLEVAGTYALLQWLQEGHLNPAEPAASAGERPAVATIAEVVTAAAVSDSGASSLSSQPSATPFEHFAMRFAFEKTELQPDGMAWADGAQLSLIPTLKEKIEALGANAKFAIVGRCDDLSSFVDQDAKTDDYNRDLAEGRAEAGRKVLRDLGVADSRISSRGEQTPWGADFVVPADLPSEAKEKLWLARATDEYKGWGPRPQNEDKRIPLRCADIYVYGVGPDATATSTPNELETMGPTQQRALVPGPDPTHVADPATPAPVPPRPRRFRVRVEVEWNDPTARGIGDAVPSRAEVLVQWPGSQAALPAGSAAVTKADGSPAPPVWTLRGRWAHDQNSGSDEFTLALDVAGSRDGIAAVRSAALAGGMGLAPAVIGAADNPSGSDAALVGALIAALGAASTLLLRDESRTVVTAIAIDHLQRSSGSGSRTMLTVDYTVELSVQAGAAGLQVSTRSGRPMKLRYRGVGVEVDTAASPWYEGAGLVVGKAVPEVVDPGSWELGPPLDDLLRVTGVRSGAGSGWLEVDLALALDLGVVKLSKATVRIVFGSGGVEGIELRGLRASVDIPGTLQGEGTVEVGNGMIHAGLNLNVVPIHLAALADLHLQGDFVQLEVGVRFPAAIPFANSGLGLFGLKGRFVSNGARLLESPSSDPVQRELDWLDQENKYHREPGQFALGLGAVVGTVPDDGFTFHALGMVTVEFPRPAVIFGVFAEMFAGTAPAPVERAAAPATGLSIIGLVVVDEDGVAVAVRGHYELKALLVVDVPVGSWFPFADPAASWVHVGSDGQPGREGAAVTITLLPDVLDVRVWAFVLVHGKGISPGLMGKPEFTFEGFSVGFGAGWEIDWSAGPIRLQASALVLAGFGTNPLLLAAGIWVRGSLDLVVLSISARGEIKMLTDGDSTFLKGEFCGSVDCFFFSIEGCVGIEIGSALGPPAAPPSPLTGVDLVSRLGDAKAKAVRPGEGEPPRVWPDTIPVLHFAHTVDAGAVGGDFELESPLPGPVWSGSRDLEYAFRITEVRLEAESGTPFHPPPGTKFKSAWWWPGVRSTTAPSQTLSAAGTEPRDLALLNWQPWTGLLPLSDPAGSPGDPASMIEDLCIPVDTAVTGCALGALGRAAGPGAAILSEPPEEAEQIPAPPLRLRLTQPGDVDWEEVLAAAGASYAAITPAGVAALEQPFTMASGREVDAGWRLAGLSRGGQPLGSLGAQAAFEPPLHDPSLVLEACPVRREEGKFEPVEVPNVCARFDLLDPKQLELNTDSENVLRWQGLTLSARSGSRLDVKEIAEETWALSVPEEGLVVAPPALVPAVVIHFAGDTKAKLMALGADGEELDSAGGGEAEIAVQGEGIASAVLFPPSGALVTQICTPTPIGAASPLLSWDPWRGKRELPDVVGTDCDGAEKQWKASTGGERGCLQIVYQAPAPGPWQEVRIGPAPGYEVKVIGACGVRWQHAFAEAQAERHRTELLETFADHSAGAAGTMRGTVAALAPLPVVFAGPPVRPLLAADAHYKVAVTWQYQEWKRSENGPSEPGPPTGTWKDGGTDEFHFATAAAGASTPVDLIAETSFDPAGAARYVTGAQPAGDLPHLLDDPIRVLFSVDYLPALLKAYGYDAFVEVRATDVAPGSQQGGTHPPNEVTEISLKTWIAGVLLPVEERVAEAIDSSPCLEGGPAGLAAEVDAALSPETAYDLVFVARRGGEERVISRSHFRTSRYRDVDELLAALGLMPGAPNPIPPGDALLEAWPSLTPAPHDDAEFGDALAQLGLDPWPLPTAPRTTTLWVPPDAARPSWGFAGVLLEAPEPIARRDRIAVSGSVGATPLAHLRSRSNGTQVLLAPSAPVTLGVEDALRIELDDGLRARSVLGGALLLGNPKTIRREVE